MGIVLAVLAVLEINTVVGVTLPQIFSLIIFILLLAGLFWLCMRNTKTQK